MARSSRWNRELAQSLGAASAAQFRCPLLLGMAPVSHFLGRANPPPTLALIGRGLRGSAPSGFPVPWRASGLVEVWVGRGNRVRVGRWAAAEKGRRSPVRLGSQMLGSQGPPSSAPIRVFRAFQSWPVLASLTLCLEYRPASPASPACVGRPSGEVPSWAKRERQTATTLGQRPEPQARGYSFRPV